MHIDHPMPKCTYTLRHNGVDGPAATFARVGDPVVHSFVCDNGAQIIFKISQNILRRRRGHVRDAGARLHGE